MQYVVNIIYIFIPLIDLYFLSRNSKISTPKIYPSFKPNTILYYFFGIQFFSKAIYAIYLKNTQSLTVANQRVSIALAKPVLSQDFHCTIFDVWPGTIWC